MIGLTLIFPFRLPSSPLMGKSQPSSPTQQQQGPSKLLPQAQKGKKVLLSRRARRVKLSTHPLKPAVVSSFFYLRGLSAGHKGEEAEEEEEKDEDEGEEVMDVEETGIEEQMTTEEGVSPLAKESKVTVEQIEHLKICDEK